MKISGRRLNFSLTLYGANYNKVKKSVKRGIQRSIRTKLNAMVKKELID